MRRLFACAGLAAIVAMPAAAQQAQGVTAFVGVHVVPMDRERVLENQTVIVRGSTIETVGPAATTRVPDGATRIEGRGRYLMPGLAEMHAHVPGGQANEEAVRDLMFLYVANGVTTIRGMLGAPSQLVLRDRMARGEILGPTFYVGAPSFSSASVPDADSAVAMVRAFKAAGYDFLKIHPGVPRDAYDAMARTAKELGISWAGHVPQAVGVRHAMASGQTTIDHLDGFLEAAVPPAGQASQRTMVEMVNAVDPAMFPSLVQAARAANVWQVPTMIVWENLWAHYDAEERARRPEMRYLPRQTIQGWVNGRTNVNRQRLAQGFTPEVADRFLAQRRQFLKALVDAGVPMLMGTDSPQVFMVPGFSIHDEMPVMVEAGMSPFQVYQSGGVNVARYAREVLGRNGDFGTVATGQRADLILVNRNPLESVANVKDPAGVMVRGHWVAREEIQRTLAEIAARNN